MSSPTRGSIFPQMGNPVWFRCQASERVITSQDPRPPSSRAGASMKSWSMGKSWRARQFKRRDATGGRLRNKEMGEEWQGSPQICLTLCRLREADGANLLRLFYGSPYRDPYHYKQLDDVTTCLHVKPSRLTQQELHVLYSATLDPGSKRSRKVLLLNGLI